MFMLSVSLLALSALSHPPVHVELQQPTRLSAMQPVGTQAGSGGGPNPGVVQYSLYWESAAVGRAYSDVCFAVAGGSHTGAHHLALYGVGSDGRPGALLGYSAPLALGSGQAVYCADFSDPVGWNVVDGAAFAGGVLALAQHEAVWLSFVRESGLGSVSYYTLYNMTALSLGAPYPGVAPVRYLTSSGWTAWADPAGGVDDAVGSGAVVLSLQVAL